MKRLVLVIPLVSVLPGCSVICPLIGYFAGKFDGTKQGDVTIDVSEGDSDNMADAEIRLSAPPLDVLGEAVIDCDNGEFSARLETADNPDFGEFEGFLRENAGDGTWSFFNPEMDMGTWQLDRMD